jgi:hypothetical protein
MALELFSPSFLDTFRPTKDKHIKVIGNDSSGRPYCDRIYSCGDEKVIEKNNGEILRFDNWETLREHMIDHYDSVRFVNVVDEIEEGEKLNAARRSLLRQFLKAMNDDCLETFFSECEGCGKWIMKGMTYCGRECLKTR